MKVETLERRIKCTHCGNEFKKKLAREEGEIECTVCGRRLRLKEKDEVRALIERAQRDIDAAAKALKKLRDRY